jgi:myo-inositol-1(or 4)-monophosphatase
MQRLLTPLIELSKSVGTYLRSEQGRIKASDIHFKGRSNDMVSRADKEAERRFVEGLSSMLPEAGFIAEEGTSSKIGEEFNWIIDPLDGTTNYLYGIPFYCTSVALRQNDTLVLGVIYDPIHDECFSAAKGMGAFLNGHPIQVSRQADLSKALVALGFPYDDRGKMRAYLGILKKMNAGTRGVRRPGAAALDMAYLACGRFDAFYEYGLSPWDIAAGSLIVSEAGGKVTDFYGLDGYLFGTNILCSNGSIHEGMMQLLESWDN